MKGRLYYDSSRNQVNHFCLFPLFAKEGKGEILLTRITKLILTYFIKIWYTFMKGCTGEIYGDSYDH
jgi:hypothetical protein